MEACTNNATFSFSATYQRLLGAGDKRMEDKLLMQSPLPVTFICIIYLSFILYLGPKLMAKRKAYSLKAVISLYNVFQVAYNAYLFTAGLHLWIKYYGWGLSCVPLIPEEASLQDSSWAAELCHLYFINKIFDLIDTVFFVLKKKDSKISTLHVFHHAVMPISMWFGVKIHPGGNLSFFAIVNSFVHIWLYVYYFAAILGPQYQKYIWWKRHLTELQLIQFGLVMTYIGYVSYICKVYRLLSYWILFLDAVFIFLFAKFYNKAYRKRTASQGTSRKTD